MFLLILLHGIQWQHELLVASAYLDMLLRSRHHAAQAACSETWSVLAVVNEICRICSGRCGTLLACQQAHHMAVKVH
jgi:hypothetical protein